MKGTKIMLACVVTFLLVWALLALIVSYLNDYTFKSSLTNLAVTIMMLLFGWIPSVIVGADLNKELE